ncbi:hypothetical protein ACO0LG_24085 [Undibacterium sp. Ji42W]|uniref:hypothetical protein n=1 Tax=Undibacterium sp. Ji42W TaxID=3413039 RepID=UPI003BF145B2
MRLLTPNVGLIKRSKNYEVSLSNKNCLVNMEIFKSLITFAGYDEGYFHLSDTIQYEGNWWLVATWLKHPVLKHRLPERIVQMDGTVIPFQEVQELEYRFLVNSPIPKSVVDGKPQAGYTITIHPASILSAQGPESIH